MTTLKIAMAQLNFLVGDIEHNTQYIIQTANTILKKESVDLIVFPELALTGYPPEDLLFRPALYQRITQALQHIQHEIKNTTLIIGCPERIHDNIYNKAIVIDHGKIIANYAKQKLPNYTVFDEKRYFTPGDVPCIFTIKNTKIGLLICEDIWHPEPIQQAANQGAELIICINASPYDTQQIDARKKIVQTRAKEASLPMVYVNLMGGQDELVFDGGSFVVDAHGNICQEAPHFTEQVSMVSIEKDNKNALKIEKKALPEKMSLEAEIYNTLTLGVKDYIRKNHFSGALVGLSGGIDSALTLAIAVDALGKENVEAILMPSPFNAKISLEDAITECEKLNVKYRVISIDALLDVFTKTLSPIFKNTRPDKTEENLQARIRAMLLMALSNKFGKIVLSTGNKSEMSVGYATLYGDMAGGLAVLKDISKTRVYQLARYRNQMNCVIPERVLTRAPTAELAPNQTDQDVLPSYDLLDKFLECYIEKDEDLPAGFDKNQFDSVVNMIRSSEYKRRQAPIGIRITRRSFGKDRRYPVTSGY